MNIGIVTETYPPETNGVALTVHDLVRGMRARGHRVQVVRPRQQHEPDLCTDEDTVRVRGAGIPGYPGLRFGLPAGRRLLRTWRRQRPDALYVATEGPLGVSAMRSARRLGVPAVTGFHTRFDHYAGHYGVAWMAPLVRRHLCRFHQRAKATLVPTAALERELAGLGIDNTQLLPRAVDAVQYAPRRRDAGVRQAWGVQGDAPVMLYVGRIAAEKNLQLAVRSYRAMQRHHPDLRYVWVGDGPARAELERKHPEFVFLGMQHGEELARSYASADLFVFPSRSETFGNVILEALASGLPTVAFDSGAAGEHVVHGHNGYLADDGDETGFIAACEQMIRGDRYRDMRASARASVAELQPESVIAGFERILLGAGSGPDTRRLARHPGFSGRPRDHGART
jgi:glycosyltransferase involved in cell wall biosynthesis